MELEAHWECVPPVCTAQSLPRRFHAAAACCCSSSPPPCARRSHRLGALPDVSHGNDDDDDEKEKGDGVAKALPKQQKSLSSSPLSKHPPRASARPGNEEPLQDIEARSSSSRSTRVLLVLFGGKGFRVPAGVSEMSRLTSHHRRLTQNDKDDDGLGRLRCIVPIQNEVPSVAAVGGVPNSNHAETYLTELRCIDASGGNRSFVVVEYLDLTFSSLDKMTPGNQSDHLPNNSARSSRLPCGPCARAHHTLLTDPQRPSRLYLFGGKTTKRHLFYRSLSEQEQMMKGDRDEIVVLDDVWRLDLHLHDEEEAEEDGEWAARQNNSNKLVAVWKQLCGTVVRSSLDCASEALHSPRVPLCYSSAAHVDLGAEYGGSAFAFFGGHDGTRLLDTIRYFSLNLEQWVTTEKRHPSKKEAEAIAPPAAAAAAPVRDVIPTHHRTALSSSSSSATSAVGTSMMCQQCGCVRPFCTHTSSIFRRHFFLSRKLQSAAAAMMTTMPPPNRQASVVPRDGHSLIALPPIDPVLTTETEKESSGRGVSRLPTNHLFLFGGELALTTLNTLSLVAIREDGTAAWQPLTGGEEWASKGAALQQQEASPARTIYDATTQDDVNNDSTSSSSTDVGTQRRSHDVTHLPAQTTAADCPSSEDVDLRHGGEEGAVLSSPQHTTTGACERIDKNIGTAVDVPSVGDSHQDELRRQWLIRVSQSPDRDASSLSTVVDDASSSNPHRLAGTTTDTRLVSSCSFASSDLLGPAHRAFHAAWAAGSSHMVIYGGFRGPHCLQSMMVYHRLTNTWRPVPQYGLTNSVSLPPHDLRDEADGRVRLEGPIPGFRGCAAYATLFPPSSSVEATGSHTATRCAHCGAPAQRHALCGGEQSDGTQFGDVWILTLHYSGCRRGLRENQALPVTHPLTPPPIPQRSNNLSRQTLPSATPPPQLQLQEDGEEGVQDPPHAAVASRFLPTPSGGSSAASYSHSLLPLKVLTAMWVQRHCRHIVFPRPIGKRATNVE